MKVYCRADGLAEYEENPDHRRAKLLSLTPDERPALAAIQAAQRAWADSLGSELGEKNRRRASARHRPPDE